MATIEQTRATAGGLTFAAHRGDGAVLLAFDADETLRSDLAGFAVTYVAPDGQTHDVLNRLSFQHAIDADTTPEQRKFLPTKEAPLQKFHWVHFPPDVQPGTFTYRATAMMFKQGTEDELEEGPSTEVGVEVFHPPGDKFTLGFTRGYISSQAYADQFNNAPIEPEPPTIDFDTAPFEKQYHWLGFHARRLIFDFLADALSDPTLSLDVFAYDLNEPDFIRQLVQLGPRLRLYLDNSSSHVKEGARELAAHQALAASAGESNIRVGHFHRFSHDKVMILKRGEQALKVLSGSANFSVRGLYVQSNNVFVIDDEATAALYEQAFEQTWNDPHGFSSSEIASKWFELGANGGLPSFAVCFSPHRDAAVSLDRVTEAVQNAKSSVLFAIMELGGSGSLLEAIRALRERKELYAFGTTQRVDGSLSVQAQGGEQTFIPFSFLTRKVPDPFREEWNGGSGQVIHHKFVVVDFNDEDPIVFAGSSNLAAGGEKENGDNLVAITDSALAAEYAVEAIQLIDHYRFRAVMRGATEAAPLRLKTRSGNWAAPYYDPASSKFVERTLFAR
jgi:phosphatidylserine/phosphatidylglycerophosphate/cardiolipin synthase-like enzyme